MSPTGPIGVATIHPLHSMAPYEPVRTPEERSLRGVVPELEEELASFRAELLRERKEASAARADLRRARIRADELHAALKQKQEQFLDMLSRLQQREEQAVRRATELAQRTREAEAARARAEAAEESLRRTIGEAGKLLGASLDYRATLASVARLATPELGDWCIIDVLDEHGRVERVAAAAADDGHLDVADRLVADCEPGDEYGAHRALGGGTVVVTADVDAALLRSIVCRPDLEEALAAHQPARALIVPMLARGHLLGAMVLLARAERGEYGPDRILLARELAGRAALAVDSARLYDAALAGSRAKSEFLAVMSHELRTPLSAIIGYSELIRSGVAGEVNDQQKEQLGRIRASADHLLELIEEILTFSQLEAGRAQARPEPLDAAELTRDLGELVRPLAGRKELELRVLGAEEPISITSDPRMLRQILLNLLSNAIKFTEAGHVELALEAGAGRVRWRVTDTGIGISRDHLEAVFTPFWQAEQSRTRRNEGSGLGLSVSHGLAELLGGHIAVRSEPGDGSTFVVDLPMHVPARASGGEQEPEEA